MLDKHVIPHEHYQRIVQVLKSLLDSEDAQTANSCQFFGIAGAAIMREHYGIDCLPVFGAAFLFLDDGTKDVISYGRIEDGRAVCSEAFYHCWIETKDSIVDFMAPLYLDAMKSKGYEKPVPRHMFQRLRSEMVEGPFELKRRGDFHFRPSAKLTQIMLGEFLSSATFTDLVNICVHWYKKPPAAMMTRFETRSSQGHVRSVELSELIVEGAW